MSEDPGSCGYEPETGDNEYYEDQDFLDYEEDESQQTVEDSDVVEGSYFSLLVTR